MTPLGYLFLDEPPEEQLGIPDFRTKDDAPVSRPSPNLLETIQVMKRRQAWMRDYLIEAGQEPLDFIGSGVQTRNVVSLAVRIREKLGLEPDWAEVLPTWEDAHPFLPQRRRAHRHSGRQQCGGGAEHPSAARPGGVSWLRPVRRAARPWSS